MVGGIALIASSCGIGNIVPIVIEAEFFAKLDTYTLQWLAGTHNPYFFALCYSRFLAICELGNSGRIPDIADNSFVFVDSDTAITVPVDKIFLKNKDWQSFAISQRTWTSNFCYWPWKEFEKFCNLDNIFEFFKNAGPDSLEIHDLPYLTWTAKNNIVKHIALENFDNQPFQFMDTIRAFIYTYGLYTGLNSNNTNWQNQKESMIEYPAGMWSDAEYMKRFGTNEFLENLFNLSPPSSSKPFWSTHIRSDFVNDCCSKRLQIWGDETLSTKNPQLHTYRKDNPPVAMVHFQHIAKCIAPNFLEFWLKNTNQ